MLKQSVTRNKNLLVLRESNRGPERTCISRQVCTDLLTCREFTKSEKEQRLELKERERDSDMCLAYNYII